MLIIIGGEKVAKQFVCDRCCKTCDAASDCPEPADRWRVVPSGWSLLRLEGSRDHHLCSIVCVALFVINQPQLGLTRRS